jgi:ABC-2 type transport system ATP-binding protein
VVIINEGSIVADGTPEELQHSFRGSETLTLEIKAPVQNALTEILPKLKSLSNVENVELRGSKETTHSFLIHTVKGSDIREELFRRAVAEQWVLLEMTRQATSLEEVFHKLTRTEPNR